MIPSILSVCNLKGGAGKSTLSVNLACAIRARTGAATVLVDADRQGTACAWARHGKLTVPVAPRILQEAKEDDRHPGALWVAHVRMLAERYRHVVIDLPPGLQFSLAAVATVSDLIVIPVGASGIDLGATATFVGFLKKSREIRCSHKPAALIVPNRLDRRTAIALDGGLYDRFEEPVAPPVGQRATFAYAFDHGQWVGDYAPRSPAHREIERLVDALADDRPPVAIRTPAAALSA